MIADIKIASNVVRQLSKDQLKDLALNGKGYHYNIAGKKYTLMDGKITKVCMGEDYSFIFDKITGYFSRWGKTFEDDPSFSPISGEILDIEITTICKGVRGVLCPFCSPKGTKINTPHGEKSIEKIRTGDLVLGFDVKSDHLTIQKVAETYKRHYTGDLICIETDAGEILKLTPEHIVILKDGIEKQAQDVNEEDELISF